MAREFEVVLARAVRKGRLDPEELLPAYLLLAPASHPYLNDARRLDLTALTQGLRALPQGTMEAPRVFLVPRLAGFTVTPVASAVFPAGTTDDGTLLIECRFGQVSLVNFAAHVAAVAHEVQKGRALLAEAGPVETPTMLALALGVDEASLSEANGFTSGALVRLVAQGGSLPAMQLHPTLSVEAITARMQERAQRILGRLAEMGLIHRPLHLFIGSDLVTDCLSPYVRDTRGVLTTWARANAAALGEDLVVADATPSEDVSYALAYDFLRTDPRLKKERAEAERAVGIHRFEDDGVESEFIDLARIDQAAMDARLPTWTQDLGGPVVVRLASDPEDDDAEMIRQLVAALASTLRSVTLLVEGSMLSGETGTIVLPHLLVGWAGEEKLAVPNPSLLSADALAGLTETRIEEGAVLSAPSAALLCPSHVFDLSRRYGVTAVSIGLCGAVSALAVARYGGVLALDVPVRWALVSTNVVRTGRSSVPVLQASAAVAIAVLRELVAPQVAAAPEPDPPESPEPKRSTGRTLRIRA